ncbi:ABC transporter permease subunit, partial [Rhizobium johnstonii]|uniref:ABC transporter permease subunit n=1 Tax=Rhizobium johnstonii TaxID=3019933 RepID=UPI003F9A8542
VAETERQARDLRQHGVALHILRKDAAGAHAAKFGNVFGGAVIVEFVFNYTGIGKLLISGIYYGDYSLVLGVTTIAIIAV